MKSIFETSTREELIKRINSVSQQSEAQWGKMNSYQMLKHCSMCEDMYLGKTVIKRVFIGRLIGKMILKKVMKEGVSLGNGSPTSPSFVTTGQSGDIEQLKKEWIGKLAQYDRYDRKGFVHPFFGPMTKEQLGIFAYKHADHHLRQFGA
jgi:hypothetical protein